MADIYRESAVAYLDMLGFSDLVRSGRAETALAALEQVRAAQARTIEVKKETDEWVRFSMFSDSIACSVPLNSVEMPANFQAFMLVNFVQGLWLALLERGICSRGAIVAGHLHHADPIVFGPALVAAVQDEKRAAVPRVLVDQRVRDLTQSLVEEKQSGRTFGHMFKRDKDGAFGLRLFSPWASPSESSGLARDVFFPRFEKVLGSLRQTASDLRVQQKLDWLLADLKEDLEEFGETSIRVWGK